MVEETSINKLPKKVKEKKKDCIGLTDINEFQYKQLKNIWGILQKDNKFDSKKKYS